MTREYRCAVVGVGSAAGGGSKAGGFQIGYAHAGAYRRSSRAILHSAADTNADNLKAFQSRFEVSRGFSDYRQMLSEAQPDVVSLCAYVGIRKEMIEACAKTGVKAIIAEKPFLASPAECVAIRNLVKATGVKIVVAHARRYLPVMLRGKALLQGGAIGTPRMVMTAVKGWDLNEMGAHWFDLIRLFNNDQPIDWVFGQARARELRGFGHAMEEHAVAYFQFRNGMRGVIDGGLAMPGPDNFTLVGSEGVIHIIGENQLRVENQSGHTSESFTGVNPSGWETLILKGEPSAEWEKPWDCLLNDTLNWIEGGPEPVTGFSSSIQTCEATLAAYVSAAVGDRVDLPYSDDLLAINEYPVEILARRARQSG